MVLLLARVRGRGFEEDEWEEAAIVNMSQMQTQLGTTDTTASLDDPLENRDALEDNGAPVATPSFSAADADATCWGRNVWGTGNTEWDGGWDTNREASANDETFSANGTGSGTSTDAWKSSW